MKKSNRKGFTLIELLAVIVILAIILVITIPTVLATMRNATQNAFDASTNSVAEWFEKQYQISAFGTADLTYTALCGADSSGCTVTNGKILASVTANAAGINSVDYNISGSKIKLYSNNRACVALAKADGKRFDNVKSPRCSSACEQDDITRFGCVTD